MAPPIRVSRCSSQTAIVTVRNLSLDPSTHVFPVRGGQRSGIDRRAAPVDLGYPSGIDVTLSYFVQTLQKSSGDLGPFVLGKVERLFQQSGGVDHVAQV